VMADSPHACIGAVKRGRRLTVTKDGATLLEADLDALIGAWKTPLEAKR